MFQKETDLATIVVCEDDEATLELLCDHLVADRFAFFLHRQEPMR